MIVVCICVLQCLDFEFQEYLRLTFSVNATMELIRHYRNNCQGDVFSRCGNGSHVCSLSTVWSGWYSGFRIVNSKSTIPSTPPEVILPDQRASFHSQCVGCAYRFGEWSRSLSRDRPNSSIVLVVKFCMSLWTARIMAQRKKRL